MVDQRCDIVYHRTIACSVGRSCSGATSPGSAYMHPPREQNAASDTCLFEPWQLMYYWPDQPACTGLSNRRDRADRPNRGARNVPGQTLACLERGTGTGIVALALRALAPLNLRLDAPKLNSWSYSSIIEFRAVES